MELRSAEKPIRHSVLSSEGNSVPSDKYKAQQDQAHTRILPDRKLSPSQNHEDTHWFPTDGREKGETRIKNRICGTCQRRAHKRTVWPRLEKLKLSFRNSELMGPLNLFLGRSDRAQGRGQKEKDP